MDAGTDVWAGSLTGNRQQTHIALTALAFSGHTRWLSLPVLKQNHCLGVMSPVCLFVLIKTPLPNKYQAKKKHVTSLGRDAWSDL